MASVFQRGVSSCPGEAGDEKTFYDAIGILEEGYLIQWAGTNPQNGEPWKPSWVAKRDCSADLVAEWTARSRRSDVSATAQIGVVNEEVQSTWPSTARTASTSAMPPSKRRLSSVVVKAEEQENHLQSEKRPRHDSSALRSRPDEIRAGVYGLPPKPPPQMFIPKAKKAGPVYVNRSTRPDSYSVHDSSLDVAADVPQKAFEITAEWLLNPVLAGKRGMLIIIRGSMGDGADDEGWFRGEYEGEKGVVLSIFSTGSRTSTARVRLLDPPTPSTPVFTVPVRYLWPVEPSKPSQNALVLDGDAKGEVARVREEDSEGWYVSVGRSQYLVVATEKMVQVVDVDVDGNLCSP